MNKSENIAELAAALAKAQGMMETAKKESKNPFFKSTYADLASVWDACRKPLAANGLSVTQLVSAQDSHQILETVLLHSSGQFLSSTLVLTPKDDSPQSIGSAITYARRYSLSALVGVAAEEDDDGESAQGRNQPPGKVDVKPEPASGDWGHFWGEVKAMGLTDGDMYAIIGVKSVRDWQKLDKGNTLARALSLCRTHVDQKGKAPPTAAQVAKNKADLYDSAPKPTEKPVQAAQAVKVARPEVPPAGADLTSPPVSPSTTPAPDSPPPAPGPLPPWPDAMPEWKTWAEFQKFYKSYGIDGSLIMQTAGAMFPGRTFNKTSDFQSFAEAWQVLQEVAILRGLNIGPVVDPEKDL